MHAITWYAATALLLTTACSGPIRDPSTLYAIRSEARMLTGSKAAGPIHVPKSKWPRTSASLTPESVTIFRDGINILVKPGFDGGSGYFIPLNDKDMPEPEEQFQPLGHGVY